MRAHRLVLAAVLLFAVLAPIAAQAQEPDRVRVITRGMLGIMTEGVPVNNRSAQQRLITIVVPGSAAERAGLQRGDVIVSVDGQPATQERMNEFAPGQTVRLRISRDGTTRDMNVVAGERTGEYRVITTEMLSDSVRGRISIIMDDVRAHADTFAVHMRRLADDSTSWTFSDGGTVFRLGGPDSMVFRFDHTHIDSMRAQVYRLSEDLPRMLRDSVGWQHFEFEPRAFQFDSRNIPVGPDSVRIFRPAEVWANSFTLGERAVAGAELTEVNEGLSEYFGTDSGVLVLNAREGTPAARAGIRSGDVIVRANGVNVGSITELRRAVESAARGSDVELQLLRRGQNLNVMLRRE